MKLSYATIRTIAMLALAAACIASDAGAFTFTDGTSMPCVAAGNTMPEIELPAQSEAEFTGRTVRSGAGFAIVWNRRKLDALPPEMHDFLFFHECAHLQVPTDEEVVANCQGLRRMRAAGRAGLGVEAKLAAFFGAGSTYWQRTLACANAADATVSPAAPSGAAPALPR